MSQGFREQRKQLVKALALQSKALEKAFLAVEREKFFAEKMKQHSYADSAFPIGFGQTISQPSTIAVMLEMLQLEKGASVLEVGAGSGYVTALLSELVGEKGKVFGIELVHELHQKAVKTLAQLGYQNIFLKCSDGTQGWEEKAGFDRILVSAADKEVPKQLIEQLNEGGKLVAPLGSRFSQELVLLQKEKDKAVEKERKCCFMFVPLKGKPDF